MYVLTENGVEYQPKKALTGVEREEILLRSRERIGGPARHKIEAGKVVSIKQCNQCFREIAADGEIDFCANCAEIVAQARNQTEMRSDLRILYCVFLLAIIAVLVWKAL